MSPTRPRCRIVYDDEWQSELAEALQRDPSADALQRGLEELADTLGELVDRPDEVLLVVAVGLASAVRRREPERPYNTERGTGTVAARTMQRTDGHIDVVIETGFIADIDADGHGRSTPAGLPRLHSVGVDTMKKTIIHEAQHVTMHQRDSDWDQFEIDTRGGAYPQWDYTVAAKIIDEYRAEWNAVRRHPSPRNPPSVSNVIDVLEHLGTELAAADARYQRAPTSDALLALMEAVYSACASYWTAIAYWAAQFRGNDLGIEADIEGLALWHRYVGPTWGTLIEVLDGVPVEDLGTPGATLREAAKRVAEWIPQSLQHLGFRHLDGPIGEAFHIDRHDFPSARS